MAQTTVELRNLLQTNFELFDFEYAFDDLTFKEKLEKAVIDYYFFAEIGQETPEAFKHKFRSKWLGMIGYYNQLHNTTLLEYNPLINYKLDEALVQLKDTTNTQESTNNTTTQGNIDTDNTVTSNQTGTEDTNTKTSDYPQQPIAGGDYLQGEQQTNTNNQSDTNTTNTTNTTNSDNTNSTGNITNTGTDNTNYEKNIEGITGIAYQDLIIKERDNLIRIEGHIINELKTCFMLTY